jgi:CRP/FNR family transcriptional regulator, anaerobic regulatory protein
MRGSVMTITASDVVHFHGLERLSAEDRATLETGARIAHLPAGQRVFEPAAPCSAYLLVIDGSVRVQMTADTGRELVLYRVLPGESCVLTTACLLGEEAYATEGIVERETRAIVVPAALFKALLARSDAFRDFVFRGFGRRVSDILAKMEAAVFLPVDARLAEALIQRAVDGHVVMTHGALAADLGSAREVISRHLKSFEQRGLVALHRGTIEICDRAELSRVARASAA